MVEIHLNLIAILDQDAGQLGPNWHIGNDEIYICGQSTRLGTSSLTHHDFWAVLQCLSEMRRMYVFTPRQIRSGTFKGELMMFLTLEDLTGTADMIVFPDVYRQTSTILDATIPTVIVGVMEMDATRTELVLRAEKVMRIAYGYLDTSNEYLLPLAYWVSVLSVNGIYVDE